MILTVPFLLLFLYAAMLSREVGLYFGIHMVLTHWACSLREVDVHMALLTRWSQVRVPSTWQQETPTKTECPTALLALAACSLPEGLASAALLSSSRTANGCAAGVAAPSI